MTIEVKKGEVIINCTPVELTILELLVRRGDTGNCDVKDCGVCPVVRNAINTIIESNEFSVCETNAEEVREFYKNHAR